MAMFKTIGTHDGVFHCDEVLGCAMLKFICPEAEVVRSRNIEKLSKCDIVIDVGGVYDPKTLRFDHHQKTFNHSMSTVIQGKTSSVKLSAAGLIYCHYGKKIIESIVEKKINEIDLEKLFDKLYDSFLKEVDAIDNGIPMCEGKPVFEIHTNLSSRVKRLNKRSNDTDYDEWKGFEQAMEMVGNEFKEMVHYYLNDWLPFRAIVLQAIQTRYDLHKSGEIIELSQICPWKGHFFEIEKELNVQPQIKFVLFPSDDTWRVQAVSIDEYSFRLRLPVGLESWRGLREDELTNISGIEHCIFVHSNGFIGGNRTEQGALEMAVRTLALVDKNERVIKSL